MIERFVVNNFLGINKETEINFELKHLKDSQLDFEEGITLFNNKKIMLTPTFISRNATGKTSLLNAIDFAYSIESIEDIFAIFLQDYEKKLNEILKSTNRSLLYDDPFNITIKKNLFYIPIKRKIIKNFKTKILNKVENFIKKYSSLIDIKENESQLKDNVQKHKKLIDEITNIFNYQKETLLESFEKSIKIEKSYIKNNLSIALESDNSIFLNIKFSDGFKKNISIGKEIIFNDKKIGYLDWIEQKKEQIENGDWFNHSHKYLENIIMYLKNKISEEEMKKIDFKFEKLQKEDSYIYNYHNLKSLKVNKHKSYSILIDDSKIRSSFDQQISIRRMNLNYHKNNEQRYFDTYTFENLISFYKFGFINTLLKLIDEDISHLEKQKNGNYVILSKNKQLKSFNTLSFGTIKTMYILEKISFAIKAGTNGVVLIDEIENGLNLSLIHFLFSIITSKSINKENIQIISTTHNPLIFSSNTLNPQTAFIFQNNSFVRAGSVKELIKRTEDLKKIFISKNYFNPVFWEKYEFSNTEQIDVIKTKTIGGFEISRLIDLLENGKNG